MLKNHRLAFNNYLKIRVIYHVAKKYLEEMTDQETKSIKYSMVFKLFDSV